MASKNLMMLMLTNNPIRLALSKSLAPAARKYATRSFRNPVLKNVSEEARYLNDNPIKPLPVITVLIYLAFVPYPAYVLLSTMLSPEED